MKILLLWRFVKERLNLFYSMIYMIYFIVDGFFVKYGINFLYILFYFIINSVVSIFKSFKLGCERIYVEVWEFFGVLINLL